MMLSYIINFSYFYVNSLTNKKFFMKKIIGVAAFAVLGMVALSSCKKDYDCIVDGVSVSECIDCKGDQKDAFDLVCALVGGSVEKK